MYLYLGSNQINSNCNLWSLPILMPKMSCFQDILPTISTTSWVHFWHLYLVMYTKLLRISCKCNTFHNRDTPSLNLFYQTLYSLDIYLQIDCFSNATDGKDSLGRRRKVRKTFTVCLDYPSQLNSQFFHMRYSNFVLRSNYLLTSWLLKFRILLQLSVVRLKDEWHRHHSYMTSFESVLHMTSFIRIPTFLITDIHKAR